MRQPSSKGSFTCQGHRAAKYKRSWNQMGVSLGVHGGGDIGYFAKLNRRTIFSILPQYFLNHSNTKAILAIIFRFMLIGKKVPGNMNEWCLTTHRNLLDHGGSCDTDKDKKGMLCWKGILCMIVWLWRKKGYNDHIISDIRKLNSSWLYCPYFTKARKEAQLNSDVNMVIIFRFMLIGENEIWVHLYIVHIKSQGKPHENGIGTESTGLSKSTFRGWKKKLKLHIISFYKGI